MFMKKFLTLSLLISAMFGMSCSAALAKVYQFEVLSTTDMHGRATAKDASTQKPVPNSMLKVATVVKQERDKFGKDKIILIDNGDLLQGTLVSQFALTQKTEKENPMLTALKYIKYDAWVMGNHEFNYTTNQRNPQLNYANNAGIATLGANIVLKEDGVNERGVAAKKGQPFYQPYIIKTINFDKNKKVRVAVIGFGNANNENWDRACNYPNEQFRSLDNPEGLLENEINKWVEKIKKDNLADVIIVSAHSGKSNDTNTVVEGFSMESQIISGVQGSKDVDLYIYGHDHQQNIEKIKNKDGKEVYIVNGGGTAVTKSIFTINFDRKHKISKCNVSSTPANLADYKNDKKLEQAVTPWYKETIAWAERPLGKFTGGWNKVASETKNKTNEDLLVKQTEVANLIHKVQIWASWQDPKQKGATVSVSSPCLQLNSDQKIEFTPQDGDTVSILNLSLLYRFSNNLICMVDMTPEQLYAWMNKIANNLMIDENGNPKLRPDASLHGTDTFFGVDYTFDLTKPEGQRVVKATINGQDLKTIKEPIRVVMNSFRIAGSHGFKETTGLTEDNAIWLSSPNDKDNVLSIQDEMALYLKQMKKVTPKDTVEHVQNTTWNIITK